MPPAAPTLVAILDAPNGRVRLEVSGSAGWEAVTIYRASPSGAEVVIRGANRWPATPPLFATADYEPPIGRALTYTATVWDSAGAESPRSAGVVVTWNTDAEWLRDLAEPSLSLPITTVSEPTLEYPIEQTALVVLNRRSPVVVSDIRRAPIHNLTLLTPDDDDRERVRRIVATGLPVLWQTGPDKGLGNVYLALDKVVERRASRLGVEPTRYWELEGPEVTIPSAEAIALHGGLSTYGFILGNHADYADVLASYPDYLTLRETPADPPLPPAPAGEEARARPPMVWRGE